MYNRRLILNSGVKRARSLAEYLHSAPVAIIDYEQDNCKPFVIMAMCQGCQDKRSLD